MTTSTITSRMLRPCSRSKDITNLLSSFRAFEATPVVCCLRWLIWAETQNPMWSRLVCDLQPSWTTWVICISSEIPIPKSFSVTHDEYLVQELSTICPLQSYFKALAPVWISLNLEVLVQDPLIDCCPEWLFRNVVLSWTACHLELLVQESWMTSHLNCLSRVLQYPGWPG